MNPSSPRAVVNGHPSCGIGRSGNFTCTALAVLWSLCAPVPAQGTIEFVDPHPASGNSFGANLIPLSTGNVIVTSPGDDTAGPDAGAVYLFNGTTGALLSTFTGFGDTLEKPGGRKRSITVLPDGNFVLANPFWNNGTALNTGAVTWASGTTGISGSANASNSLIGPAAESFAGHSVVVLAGGKYLVTSPSSGGTSYELGAVTWCGAGGGPTGPVTTANSLVGGMNGDRVGSGGITVLTNGNYVVSSPAWYNGAAAPWAGAVTWGSGEQGVTGVVSSRGAAPRPGFPE